MDEKRQVTENLDQIRSAITLSKNQMNELVHNNEKFLAIVRKFSNEAKLKLGADSPQEALVYLAEAEKILEYAASCGKNIDRSMIVCVLHNEACCYQKLWELEKCSNYIEALIFNVSTHLKANTVSPRIEEDNIKTSTSLSSRLKDQLYGKSLVHRIQLCTYQLQFCAINSQLRNHSIALVSGQRAISIIKDCFKQLHSLAIEKKAFDQNYGPSLSQDESSADFEAKIQVLKGISCIEDKPNFARHADYVATARYYFKKWNIKKLQQTNEALKESLKNFSVGSIMQMRPLSFQQSKQNAMDADRVGESVYEQENFRNILKMQTYSKIIHKALLLTISYFAVATQLRLIASDKYKSQEESKKKCEQYRQSQIYHIIALILTCIYIPFDMLYIRHLMTSYTNHYSINISEEKASSQEQAEGVIMNKEFGIMGYSLSSSFKIFTKNAEMNINRSLALEFAESIRIGNQVSTTELPPIQYREEEQMNEIEKTVKQKFQNLILPERKDNKSKAHSFEGPKKTLKTSRKMKRKEKEKGGKKNQLPDENKMKTQSLQHKSRKNVSNHSKTDKKKKKKEKEKQCDKPKQQYYKNKRQTTSPSNQKSQTAKCIKLKPLEHQHQRVKQKIERQKSAKQMNPRSSKAMQASGSLSSFQNKEKGATVKKNLDRYYF